MRCEKCGAELFGDEEFCVKCGARIGTSNENSEIATQVSYEIPVMNTEEKLPPTEAYKKAVKKVVIGFSIFLILLILLIVILNISHNKTNNRSDSDQDETSYSESDVFELVDVHFEGTDGSGRAVVTYNDSFEDFTITFENDGYLSNGHYCVAYIEMTDEQLELYREQYNSTPRSYEKSYWVDGLTSETTTEAPYTNTDFIVDNLDEFKSFAESYYYNEDFDVSESPTMEYVGDIILENKNSDDGSSDYIENELLIVYKIKMRNSYSGFSKTTEFYWYMGYYNVDENFVFANYRSQVKESANYVRPAGLVDVSGGGRYWQYRGYYNLSDMKSEEIDYSVFNVVEDNT